MNKVFKVIWSEARNAYVVVSEIAKNHGSKSCSTKKLLTMLIATGVMTCASMAPAMAANPAPDDKNVTIGKGAVSSPYVGQTGNVAIGENAKAWNGNGRQEAYVDFGQGGIKGGWFGVDVKDGTKLPGSIAIGKNTVARSGSTMIGDHGYTGKIGDTTITPDGNGIMKYNNDVYSTTIGANSFNSGALASVTGVFSIASSKFDGSGGFNTLYAVQNTGATIYGSMNSIESATSSSMYSGVANSVLGFANRTQNANAALVWGTGNEVTNSVETIDIDTDWNNVSVAEAQQKAIKAMQTSDYAGGSVMAIGGGNKADYAKYSQLTGVQNKVTGTKAKAAKYDFVNGYKNTVTEASDVTVIGGKNEVTADGNKVIGDNHKVSGKDNVIFGSADKLTETTVNNAVVLGHNAKVTGEGGVALGADSVADRANAVSVGSKDANRQIINVAEGKADTDAVNVSQLKDVKAEALKHSTVTNGANITVTEGLNKDGGKEYNVALNNDIHLFGDNDAMVSISGSKGTIWTSGSVTAGSVAVGTAKADGTTPFFVDSNGAFYAADSKFSVDKDGNANANSVQTNALNAKYNLSVGTANENGTVPFFVNSNGAFYAANGKLVVDKDGKVTATEGEIGNVVLKDGVFYKNTALRDGELYVGDADGNYSQITPKSAKLGQVTIDEKGNIAGVNSVQTNALNAKYNLSVGTANENGIMPFFVNSNGAFYGANNNFSVDKDGKVTATAGEIGNVVLKDGVFYKHTALRDGELFVGDASGNYSQITTKGAKLGKVTVAEDGKISGVAAGAVTADSTDAVNGSQLHAVATEAGKHSKVVNGSNINVEETDVDGQKIYKVNLNKDIMLGDLTGKNVNISGTNGTIETTGYIATKDRVYADKGAKLADIDVTGDKISNGASSIVLDGSNVKVNDKVTIDQNGKISGVAAGEISSTSTDAINGSQLHQTNEKVDDLNTRVNENTNKINALDTRVNENTNKINALDTRVTDNETAIKNNADAIGNLNTRVDGVEKLAKQHTTVKAGDNNIKVSEVTTEEGRKEYTVALDKNITVDSVKAGDTTISGKGLEIKDGPSVTKDGINAANKNITNVADGKVEKDSKDAINGGQLHQAKADINNRIDGVENQVVSNTNRINQLGSRVNKVGAGAAALAALHPMDFDPDDKLTFSAGYGNYGGENAAAIGAYYRPDEKVMFSVGGTVGNGENMVNAGVSFSLDRTNHVSNSRTAMAREILDLRAEVTELKAMVAKGGLGSIAEDKMKIFPDVAENHWAYEYVGKLAAAGIIEGYPDGKFSGDRMMSRYEFAAMLYRAMQKGAQLDSKIINEFAPEMGRIRVDRISGEDGDRDKIERVRVNAVKGERDHYGNKLAK